MEPAVVVKIQRFMLGTQLEELIGRHADRIHERHLYTIDNGLPDLAACPAPTRGRG